MLPIRAQGRALAIFGAGGIFGDDLEDQATQRREQLGVRPGLIALGLLGPLPLDRRDKFVELIEKQGVRKQVPALYSDHWSERDSALNGRVKIDFKPSGQGLDTGP